MRPNKGGATGSKRLNSLPRGHRERQRLTAFAKTPLRFGPQGKSAAPVLRESLAQSEYLFPDDLLTVMRETIPGRTGHQRLEIRTADMDQVGMIARLEIDVSASGQAFVDDLGHAISLA